MIGTEGAIEFIVYSCRGPWLQTLAGGRSLNTCASVAWGARSPTGWVVNARDWRMGGQAKAAAGPRRCQPAGIDSVSAGWVRNVGDMALQA
jgi:hypothetical protein